MPDDPAPRFRLQPLGRDCWRLCDSAVAEADAEVVLAYVERRSDGRYEATWVRGGAGSALFGSVDALLSGAARHLAECAPRRVKPRPIAHRPPLAPI
ncbi:hypothetical protein [Microbacterium dauci]|uniref:Uncharacterized protein n=1 Tax=Microbacterium dauci TaxID=3048008 RepID=A0ABT6ZEH3_9MICO|nr:hypothetical protein [Microbacterium sp. LX3-4]MDJ1114566.1 hypothetical protein [Microbacterium sp. LX3-4]